MAKEQRPIDAMRLVTKLAKKVRFGRIEYDDVLAVIAEAPTVDPIHAAAGRWVEGMRMDGARGKKMREILFRGKTTKDKEWVYGDLLHDGYHYDVAIWEQKYKLVTEISLETIGQFTGMTDKNGNKIFEGDIVRDEYNGGIAWIAFLPQGCGWHLVFKNTDRRLGHRSRNSAYDNDLMLEVVGNIHDNPELLEVNVDGSRTAAD